MRRAICIALMMFAIPCAMSARQGAGGWLSPADDSAYARKVVATIGPISITAKEFLIAYDFGPAFPKREKNSKQKFLGFMINEKLLALDAAAHGARRDGSVIRSETAIVHDLITEELYRDDVLRRVRVTKEELQDAVTAQRRHYGMRWIYSPTREGVERYQAQLAAGVSFDTLFRAALGDSVTSDERSWATTRFRVQTLRPEIAAVADTLKQGQTSAPIEGPDGWYLLCLQSTSFDAITNSSEAVEQQRVATEVLRQLKADSLSGLYVNNIMEAHTPVIVPRTFDLLSVYLAQAWLPENLRTVLFSFLTVDREIALSAASDPQRFANDRLVKMTNGAVTMGRFLAWYDARSTILKLPATSVHAFQVSLEQLIWRMVRDGLLIERAEMRNYQRRPSVVEQKGWWADKILYAYEKQKLLATVTVTDSALKNYFQTHLAGYRRERGDTVTFAGVLDDVRRDYQSQEMTARVLRKLIALKREYPVKIHEDVLASLPVDEENSPRAIDVYVAKKGGTFPHPAFPTIDYDWQTWE